MDLCFLFSQLLGVKGGLVPSFKLPEPIVMTSLGRREGKEERSMGSAPTASRLLPSVLLVSDHTVVIVVSTHPVPQGEQDLDGCGQCMWYSKHLVGMGTLQPTLSEDSAQGCTTQSQNC